MPSLGRVVLCPRCRHDSYHAALDERNECLAIYCAGCGHVVWAIPAQVQEDQS